MHLFTHHVLVYPSCTCLPIMQLFTHHVLVYPSCACLPIMHLFTHHVLVYPSCTCLPIMYLFTHHVLVYPSCTCLPIMQLFTHHALVCLEQRVKTKEGQIENFWTSADFGYVKKRLGELRYMCEPTALVSKFAVHVFKCLFFRTALRRLYPIC